MASSAPGVHLAESSVRSMGLDPSDPPTQFTHAQWMTLKNALFASSGIAKDISKAMNIVQHYYSELMNTVAVKGRIFAEVVATHYTVGGANPKAASLSCWESGCNCCKRSSQIVRLCAAESLMRECSRC